MTLKEKLKRFVKAKLIDADILSQVDKKVEKIKLDAEKKFEQLGSNAEFVY